MAATATKSLTNTLRPLGDFTLVKRHELPDREGNIYVIRGQSEKAMMGTVIAVGPGKRDAKGNLTVFAHKAGDTVFIGKYSGIDVPGNENLVLVPFDKVFARVEDADSE